MNCDDLGFVGDIRVRREIVSGPDHLLTVPVVLSLLAVVAGYERVGSVRTERVAQATEEDAHWSDFLTYILSYPRGISVTVDIRTGKPASADIRTSATGETVVLASGGLDSTAAILGLDRRNEPYTVCWINYGQPYSDIEQRAVLSLQTVLAFPLIRLRVDLTHWMMAGQATYGHIVPARNVLLVALATAATSASNVCIVSLRDEEVVPDKSLRFYEGLSHLLGVNVFSPFSAATKTDLVAWWDKQGFPVSPEATVSCYSGSGRCGKCRACIKRAIAFSANGRTVQMDENPFEDHGRIMRDDYLSRWSTFSDDRRLDMLLALQRTGTTLPLELDRFLEDHLAQVAVRTALQARTARLGAWNPKWP